LKKKETKLKQIDNLKTEIENNIVGFDTQIKELTGARNYAQFLLEKIKKANNGA